MIIIKKYGEYDITKLSFLGKGMQGSVYKIDEARCIKIFSSEKTCRQEVETLKMAEGDPHFPKLYNNGKNYIVREYIDGIELDKYLKNYPLTMEMSMKLIYLYEAMDLAGYRRLDAILFHIFVTPEGNLRMIDTARLMKKSAVYPKIILDGLKELGYKEMFMEHVKVLRPSLYEMWMKRAD